MLGYSVFRGFLVLQHLLMMQIWTLGLLVSSSLLGNSTFVVYYLVKHTCVLILGIGWVLKQFRLLVTMQSKKFSKH